MCEDWGWQGCGPQSRGRAAESGEGEDEASWPDRAERRRNGLAKLVPVLKPRNGLNDSWRVGGCGHSVLVSTTSLSRERGDTFPFYFPRILTYRLLHRRRSRRPLARRRRERGCGKRHGRKILPSFLLELPSFKWSFMKINSVVCAPRPWLLKISHLILLFLGWRRINCDDYNLWHLLSRVLAETRFSIQIKRVLISH